MKYFAQSMQMCSSLTKDEVITDSDNSLVSVSQKPLPESIMT